MVSPVNKFAPNGVSHSASTHMLSASAYGSSTVAPSLALTSVWADEGSNVGEVANGGSTDDRTVQLQGTGVPGAYIIVVHNGSNIAVTVAADGRWQHELRLQPGQNEVVVRSISETTEPYFIEYAPPAPPRPHVASVWADEGQVGEVGNGGTTDDRTVQVRGHGTPGTFIYILVNGEEISLGFSIDGKWQTELTLEEGRNEIVVWSSEGNSEPFVVDYVSAETQSAITSVSGVESQEAIGNSESTAENLVSIEGTGMPGAQLKFWGVGGGWTGVQVGADGTWQIYSLLDDGRNEFRVEYDGQVSEAFVVDYVAAASPQVADSISEGLSGLLVDPSANQLTLEALLSEPHIPLWGDDTAELTSTAATLVISEIDWLETPDQGLSVQVAEVPTSMTLWLPVDDAQLQSFH
jgi:hypothetical protein